MPRSLVPRLPSRLSLLCSLAACALLSTGCPDSVGIVCPPDDPACGSYDFAAPIPTPDAAAAIDLRAHPVVDLTPPPEPDLTACPVVCPPARSDSCVMGACACGNQPACAIGQRCIGGGCVCDLLSCASGCCDANLQCTTPSAMACGDAHGGTCKACSPNLADGCLSGCTCGGGRACPSGQRCANGACVCDAQSCPNGCCLGLTCTQPSPMTCGTMGGACTMCSALIADNCTNGACQCGPAPACGAGLQCVGGACVCTPQSCMGCCSNNVCKSGNDLSFCGAGGSPCSICGQSQLCANGVCSGCNAQNCPLGCCLGDACTKWSLSSCSPAGSACVACDRTRSDSCEGGICGCGNGPPCGYGLACVNGACICNPQSCPQGCCLNNQCTVFGNGSTQCGNNGGACANCDPLVADSCTNGQCGCGNAGPCIPGLECINHLCQCDAKSCPNGCCQAGACMPQGNARICGIGGVACTNCPLGQVCDLLGGGCICPQGQFLCAASQRCVLNCALCNGTPVNCVANNACVADCNRDCAGTANTCNNNNGSLSCVHGCSPQACPSGNCN